jgi:hypothetical protein
MDGLWRGEKKKREREAIYKHEEVLGSGESRDKHVTTLTAPFRTDLDTPIPTLYIKTSLFFLIYSLYYLSYVLLHSFLY